MKRERKDRDDYSESQTSENIRVMCVGCSDSVQEQKDKSRNCNSQNYTGLQQQCCDSKVLRDTKGL
jgi:hypothetical protein